MHHEPPIEDALADVLRKARRGLGLEAKAVAATALLTEQDILAIEQEKLTPAAASLPKLAHSLRLKESSLRRHLAGTIRQVPLPVGVTRIVLDRYGVNAYLWDSPDGRVLIDAGDDPDLLIAAAGQVPCVAILITHGHQDHVAVAAEVARRTGAALYGPETLRLPGAMPLRQGDRLYGLTVWLVPGHSDDHLAFVGEHIVFVGDLYFAGSLGGASSAARYPVLLESAAKLLTLPDEMVLLPGHGPATTVGLERQQNPFLLDA